MNTPYGPPRRPAVAFTAKRLLLFLAFASMCGSSVYWWGVQSQLTDTKVVAVAYTAILVLAPPALTSFLIPWSPGGMLLQKVNARTWGYVAVVGCALFLIYYSFQIQWSWWAAQQIVVKSDLVYQQVAIGIIGFIWRGGGVQDAALVAWRDDRFKRPLDRGLADLLRGAVVRCV
jgi:hypothetical protein